MSRVDTQTISEIKKQYRRHSMQRSKTNYPRGHLFFEKANAAARRVTLLDGQRKPVPAFDYLNIISGVTPSPDGPVVKLAWSGGVGEIFADKVQDRFFSRVLFHGVAGFSRPILSEDPLIVGRDAAVFLINALKINGYCHPTA